MGPRCGARHEALNEGFLSAVGGFTQRGVELDTGGLFSLGSQRLWLFEALQVIPRYCLLMEFSVRWVSGGLSEWA